MPPVTPHADAGMAHRRRTSTPGTIPLCSAAAGKPSRLGPSRTSEMGDTGELEGLSVGLCPGCTHPVGSLLGKCGAPASNHPPSACLQPLAREHPPSEHAPLAASRTLYPAADAMRRQTVASGMTSTSPATAAAAAKPAVVLLPARSASDHPTSWSIHAFDAGSAGSTPVSCPGTPAAQTPSAAPISFGSACPSGSGSSSTGECRGVQGKAC